jgi:hypothetical protein
MAKRSQKRDRTRKLVEPTGIDAIDQLSERCSIHDYVSAASAYVLQSGRIKAGPKKAGQIRLSAALGRALVGELRERLPHLENVVVGESKVAGALRTTNADVSQIHALDGLRLAVELKPGVRFGIALAT